jgi:hypothetical protein
MIGTSDAWTFDARRSRVIAEHGVGIRSVWRPTLGAFFDDAGVSFRVWAPTTDHVDLLLNQAVRRNGVSDCNIQVMAPSPGPSTLSGPETSTCTASMAKAHIRILVLDFSLRAYTAPPPSSIALNSNGPIASGRACRSSARSSTSRTSGRSRRPARSPELPRGCHTSQSLVLSTREARFQSAAESTPAPEITEHDPLVVAFHGPAAVILRRE